jgi:hypothetical protein
MHRGDFRKFFRIVRAPQALLPDHGACDTEGGPSTGVATYSGAESVPWHEDAVWAFDQTPPSYGMV